MDEDVLDYIHREYHRDEHPSIEERITRLEEYQANLYRAVGALRERCLQHGIPAPEYDELDAL